VASRTPTTIAASSASRRPRRSPAAGARSASTVIQPIRPYTATCPIFAIRKSLSAWLVTGVAANDEVKTIAA
jgi:hypothetical protein